MTEIGNDARVAGQRRAVDTEIHARIGSHLKALYDVVVDQPVPDRFEDLLRRLEEQSNPGSTQEKN